MSLKAFHLVFIVASAILALWFAAWCFEEYYVFSGAASIVVALGLAGYLVWFLKKSKGLSYIVWAATLGPILLSSNAYACAVCLGNADSPLVKSANAAVVLLLGVVCSVLIAFAALFISWVVRARRLAA